MRVIGTASRATPLPRPTTALQGELLRAQEDRLRACGGGHVGVSRRVNHVLREHHATATPSAVPPTTTTSTSAATGISRADSTMTFPPASRARDVQTRLPASIDFISASQINASCTTKHHKVHRDRPDNGRRTRTACPRRHASRRPASASPMWRRRSRADPSSLQGLRGPPK